MPIHDAPTPLSRKTEPRAGRSRLVSLVKMSGYFLLLMRPAIVGAVPIGIYRLSGAIRRHYCQSFENNDRIALRASSASNATRAKRSLCCSLLSRTGLSDCLPSAGGQLKTPIYRVPSALAPTDPRRSHRDRLGYSS